MNSHPIPDAALAQHVAVVGKTGAGKSYAAKGIVERLLGLGRRVCVIDPTSAWWGLRSSADGARPGFPVAVFGGEHADVAIAPGSGAALAAIVAEILWMCAEMAPNSPAREGLIALEGFFDNQEAQGGAFFAPDTERRRWLVGLTAQVIPLRKIVEGLQCFGCDAQGAEMAAPGKCCRDADCDAGFYGIHCDEVKAALDGSAALALVTKAMEGRG